MIKIIIATVGAVLLAFILSLHNIQNQREAVLKPFLEEFVKTVVASEVNRVMTHLHGEYLSDVNKADNENWLMQLHKDLAPLGPLSSISSPVFSYRSATRPFKTDFQSDVYIVQAHFEQGDVLFRIGTVNSGTSDPNRSPYYVDRLYVSSAQLLDNAGKQKRFSLKVMCSEEKNIKKNCTSESV